MDLIGLIDLKASTRADRIAQVLGRFLDAYDAEFLALVGELKFHQDYLEAIERRILEGVIVVEDARRLAGMFFEGNGEAFPSCLEALRESWIPHVEGIRQTVAQLMMSRQFKSRPCWIQLRDKTTFMIMVLEELDRLLREDEITPFPAEKVRERRPLAALLAEEAFTVKESHEYDIEHLAMQAFLARDDEGTARESSNPLARLLRAIREWFGAASKELRRKPGAVDPAPFLEVAELLDPIREVFASGLENYAQNGLPPIYYHYLNDSNQEVHRRVLFLPLLRNLETLKKTEKKAGRPLRRGDALQVFFEPACHCLREVKMASEFLFHGAPQGGPSPELAAIEKLIPLAAGSLRDLSLRIAQAEAEERG